MDYEGRTILLSIDLTDGEQQIMYETGYQKPDYDLLWEYVLTQYGTVRPQGTPGHPVPADLMHRVAESQQEHPLPSQSDGAMEFFVEPFVIVAN